MDEVAAMLRQVLRTDNRLTFPVSGTGSAGMEAAIVNVVEPGDTVIVGVNGVFGGRLADTARRAGAEVVALEEDWGRIVDPERVAEAHAAHPDAKAVVLVHAETSTGAHQPLAEVGALLADTPTLLVVDAVTSLGGVPVEVDDWHLDVVYSGTQKCLSVPARAGPGHVLAEGRAGARRPRHARAVLVPRRQRDPALLERPAGQRAYHHTAPISALYGLHEGLRLVLEEGLPARWDRHRRVGERLQAALVERGGRLLAQEGHRLPQLTSVGWPRTRRRGRVAPPAARRARHRGGRWASATSPGRRGASG